MVAISGITPELRANYAGENIYIRFDRVPAAVKVRWVKCGSSVGGNAVTISTDGRYTIGTTRLSYPIEAYFDYVYHP